jgi:archaellum biogenesis protein FlaJ (TadC family)
MNDSNGNIINPGDFFSLNSDLLFIGVNIIFAIDESWKCKLTTEPYQENKVKAVYYPSNIRSDSAMTYINTDYKIYVGYFNPLTLTKFDIKEFKKLHNAEKYQYYKKIMEIITEPFKPYIRKTKLNNL